MPNSDGLFTVYTLHQGARHARGGRVLYSKSGKSHSFGNERAQLVGRRPPSRCASEMGQGTIKVSTDENSKSTESISCHCYCAD